MTCKSALLFAALAACGICSTRLAAEDLLPQEVEIAAAIDHYVEGKLGAEGLAPAPAADDAEFLRRVSLDLTGAPPTLGELREFLASGAADRRTLAVDRLMNSPAFARHQANQFNTLLMGPGRENLREYLLEAFQQNRTWDQIFRDLILAEKGENARKNVPDFIRTRVSDLDKLANDASVIFFGVNVSCAQCHDHPLAPDWTQEHFFGMKSFFSRTFDHGEFVGERAYGKVEYKTTEGEARAARPMFLTGAYLEEPETPEPTEEEKKTLNKELEELKKNKQPAPAPPFSRRAKLVEMALAPGQNQFFSKAIVNQLWNRLLGRGLVAPVDQMHSENPASHPELLDWLARDLTSRGYDLRPLVRGIALSKAYGRSSSWTSGELPPPELYAVAVTRPLSPLQYAMALRVGTTNPDQFLALSGDDLAKRLEPLEGAARGLAGLFEQPTEGYQVSVEEALLFSNNPRIENELLRDAGDSLVGKLKALEDPREVAETAFWSVLSRAPHEDEVTVLTDYLASRADRPIEARKQIVWALITSSECRFNH